MYMQSLPSFSRWLNSHPYYRDRKDEIVNSCINGYLFECSFNSVIISPDYIHAFNGYDSGSSDSYVSNRSGECYEGDEYHFKIRSTPIPVSVSL